MEQIFRWVKSITYYLVFIRLVINLLPNARYERYIRLFYGAVFILLVMSPLTTGLKLDKMLAFAYEELCLEEDGTGFEDRAKRIEDKWIEQTLTQYEEAVSQDIKSMAEAEGFSCRQVRARIEKRDGEEDFGKVTGVELVLERQVLAVDSGSSVIADGADEEEKAQARGAGGTVESIQIQVELEEDEGLDGPLVQEPETETGGEQEGWYGFQRKVAEHYGLDEKAVRITWEDD